MQSDEQQIRELVAAWMAASKTGDVQTVLDLMADDVPPIERAGRALAVLRKARGKWLLARDANLLAPVQRPQPSTHA